MSTVDKWMNDLAAYFVYGKRIEKKPDPKSYITKKYLQKLAQKKKK